MRINLFALHKFFLTHKKQTFISIFSLFALSGLLLGSYTVVRASWGVWGDSSLVHACKDSRGRVTIVASTDSCNTNETQLTWLKDVDAGTGLTATRSSSGVTLSLANNNADGWYSADETWTYASADSPTFTFTISGDVTNKYSPGMRVKLTQTTTKYFIITAVSYSSPNTTVTVYGGTDYALTNTSITSPYYSTMKAPQGFPLDPAKWTVQVSDNTNRNQASPTLGTWYNVGSISITIPIGAWDVSYKGTAGGVRSSGSLPIYTTLSTANNSESDSAFTLKGFGNPITDGEWPRFIENNISLTSKTTYYYNSMTDTNGVTNINNNNAQVKLIIRAISSYF